MAIRNNRFPIFNKFTSNNVLETSVIRRAGFASSSLAVKNKNSNSSSSSAWGFPFSNSTSATDEFVHDTIKEASFRDENGNEIRSSSSNSSRPSTASSGDFDSKNPSSPSPPLKSNSAGVTVKVKSGTHIYTQARFSALDNLTHTHFHRVGLGMHPQPLPKIKYFESEYAKTIPGKPKTPWLEKRVKTMNGKHKNSPFKYALDRRDIGQEGKIVPREWTFKTTVIKTGYRKANFATRMLKGLSLRQAL